MDKILNIGQPITSFQVKENITLLSCQCFQLLVGVVFTAIVLLHSYLWIKDVASSQLYHQVAQTNSSLNQTDISHEQTTSHSQTVNYPVPNIVHFVWYQEKPVEFTFDRTLSVLSAVKYLQPDAILFHTNNPPTGPYFEMLQNISNFKVWVYVV